jgi:hypothetical protein
MQTRKQVDRREALITRAAKEELVFLLGRAPSSDELKAATKLMELEICNDLETLRKESTND